MKIAQGRESAKNFLKDNPEVAFEIEEKIKAKITGAAEAALAERKAKSEAAAAEVEADAKAKAN